MPVPASAERGHQRTPHTARLHGWATRGLFTGSGVVEAGREAVVGQRLKLPGMRPAVPGAEAIIALRGREAGSHREEIWQRPRNQTATA